MFSSNSPFWSFLSLLEVFRAVELLVGHPWKPYEKVNPIYYPYHSYKIPASSLFDLEPILGTPNPPGMRLMSEAFPRRAFNDV